MQHIDTFRGESSYTFVFDRRTELGNYAAMVMGKEGWPWEWTAVPYDAGEANEHLGERIGTYDLYNKIGETAWCAFIDRLSINSESGRVVVEVYGGVADVTSKPEGIDVEIIDHDNEEES